MFARAVHVFPISFMINLFTKKKEDHIPFNFQFLIWWAGSILFPCPLLFFFIITPHNRPSWSHCLRSFSSSFLGCRSTHCHHYLGHRGDHCCLFRVNNSFLSNPAAGLSNRHFFFFLELPNRSMPTSTLLVKLKIRVGVEDDDQPMGSLAVIFCSLFLLPVTFLWTILPI